MIGSVMTFLGCCPTEDYRDRISSDGVAAYDCAKRIFILVGVLLMLVGIAMIAATCAYHCVHPAIGPSLFLAGLIGSVIGASLPSPSIVEDDT